MELRLFWLVAFFGFISVNGRDLVLNFDETRMNKIIKAVRPLVLFDCIFVVLLGPIGNLQMFVLQCPEGYVSVALRIGF